jgi:diguanylate cyclase
VKRSTNEDDFTVSTDRAEAACEAHAWRSNPLDWRPIDRMILLGALLMIAPLISGVALLATMLVAPSYLVAEVAYLLLALCGAHAFCLAGFLVFALGRRRRRDDWPSFENFIIVSFVVNVLSVSYATGTHFTEGLLIFFVGLNTATALVSIRKILVAYAFVSAAMVALAVSDFTGALAPAPLFARLPIEPSGAPVVGWLAVQVAIAAVILAIGRIGISAVARWIDRENLFREMSTVDGLTRLTNRRSFMERGETELTRARRVPAGGLACIIVDLDHFKRINDTFGHHAGDRVLVAASAILMASARQYDEVGRYGGEEFALLLPAITLEDAVAAAERIREKIASTIVEVDGQHIPVTASFGVAHYPSEGVENLDDLLKAADRALYEAKETGRNKVVAARGRMSATG